MAANPSDVDNSGEALRLAVALYRRDPISGDARKRQIYKHESYHWGVLVLTSGNRHDAYDATDRNDIDPATFRQKNPQGNWWFNPVSDVEPSRSSKFLGYIVVGTLPAEVTRQDVRTFLEEVPIPKRGQNPQESCVTWVASALRKCCDAQWVEDLDVDKFMDWALKYADQRLARSNDAAEVAVYDRATE